MPGPSNAQRVRSILGRCLSAQISRAGSAQHEHVETELERVLLTAEPIPPGLDTDTVTVEVAEACPLPVRERIRGRVRFTGITRSGGAPADTDALVVYAEAVWLEEDGRRVRVPTAEVVGADLDPIAESEAAMLMHLEADHTEVIELLTRLVPARDRQDVARVWPYRLDQHGLVLRLERRTGHVDHVLAFPAPLASVDDLHGAVHRLVHAAQQASSARDVRVAGVRGALRATRSAERLCRPGPDELAG